MNNRDVQECCQAELDIISDFVSLSLGSRPLGIYFITDGKKLNTKVENLLCNIEIPLGRSPKQAMPLIGEAVLSCERNVRLLKLHDPVQIALSLMLFILIYDSLGMGSQGLTAVYKKLNSSWDEPSKKSKDVKMAFLILYDFMGNQSRFDASPTHLLKTALIRRATEGNVEKLEELRERLIESQFTNLGTLPTYFEKMRKRSGILIEKIGWYVKLVSIMRRFAPKVVNSIFDS